MRINLIAYFQNVVTLPNRNPINFFRFFALSLAHKLAVPSTSKYSSQNSCSLALSASSAFTFSDRESPDTNPLSGRDKVMFVWLKLCNWANHRATFAVEDNCKGYVEETRLNNSQWKL